MTGGDGLGRIGGSCEPGANLAARAVNGDWEEGIERGEGTVVESFLWSTAKGEGSVEFLELLDWTDVGELLSES